MGAFEHFPYTNYQDQNLDWILNKIKAIDKETDDFVAYNKITWAGLWDANKTYLAWSVVTDKDGNGYLSLQAVPKNVPLTDTDHWQLIANYSALYAAFGQRIADLESAMQDAEDRIAALETGDNKAYLLISDSYGTDSISVDRLSWCTQLATIMGLTMGVNCFKYYTPGAGFAHNGGEPGSQEGKNLCDVLNNAIAGMTAEQRESITDIVIGGGVNDWDGTDADTATGITNFNTIARANFPNAQIWMVCCGWAKRGDIRYETNRRYIVDFAKGSEYGWIVDNRAYQALQDKSKFVADGVHPTIEGSLEIARGISNLLRGGSGMHSNSTAPVDIAVGGSVRGRAYVAADNMVHAVLNTFSPGALPNISAGATIDAAEITCNKIFGGQTVTEETIAVVNMKIGGTWKTKRMGAFFRYDYLTDKTYLCLHNNVELDGTSFGSYTSIQDSYVTVGTMIIAPYC